MDNKVDDATYGALILRATVTLLESLRREEGTRSPRERELHNPYNGDKTILDYASAGSKIDTARHHLDEGLPNGQRQRCEVAYKLLMQGAAELGVWMRANRYDV